MLHFFADEAQIRSSCVRKPSAILEPQGGMADLHSIVQKRCQAEVRISKGCGHKTDVNKADTACAPVTSIL